MKLVLRAAAERDLDGVFDYSVVAHGADRAERYMRDLQAGMDRLLDHPELGATACSRQGLRAYGVREHRVYYRVEEARIVIVRVLHKAMDAGRHL